MTRMAPRGVRAKRWSSWHRQERSACVKRDTQCIGLPMCPGDPTDWHHLAGRKHIIAEPYASWRVFTLMLCPDCHHRAHAEAAHAERIRRYALVLRGVMEFGPGSGLDRIREIVRGLVAAGWRPDTDEPPPEGWERAA